MVSPRYSQYMIHKVRHTCCYSTAVMGGWAGAKSEYQKQKSRRVSSHVASRLQQYRGLSSTVALLVLLHHTTFPVYPVTDAGHPIFVTGPAASSSCITMGRAVHFKIVRVAYACMAARHRSHHTDVSHHPLYCMLLNESLFNDSSQASSSLARAAFLPDITSAAPFLLVLVLLPRR